MGAVVVDDLVAEITKIPVQPGAAMRLMRMLDDPRSSAETLGKVVETDPALSARLIQLSNSSFYALSAPVSSAWRAVTVIGMATLRSMVATAILDIGGNDGISVPEGFWGHSIATAAAASVVAPRADVQPGDAFSVALLHDVGSALMFRRARDVYDEVVTAAEGDGLSLVEAELAILGVTHAEIGARALASLGFNEEGRSAVEHHHAGDEPRDPLTAVLRASDTIAAAIGDEVIPEAERDLAGAMQSLKIAPHEESAVMQRVCEVVDELDAMLNAR